MLVRYSKRRCRSILAVSLSAGALSVPLSAHATYSTVAMERSTGRYGAISASCVRLSTLQRVYASVPDHGAVLTQSHLVEGDASQALALQRLGEGASAAEVVAAMTDPAFDAAFSLRQYVVLDAYGGLAGFSGVGAELFAGHLDASDEAFSVGIAGNFLTGSGVLEAAALGFRQQSACDLEEHLVNALVAASEDGLGDARCVADGRPAQATWLHVAGTHGTEDLDIGVDAAPGIDPIKELLGSFSEWRSSHPCPAESPNPPPSSAARSESPGSCATARAGGGPVEHWVWLLIPAAFLLPSRRRARAPWRG